MRPESLKQKNITVLKKTIEKSLYSRAIFDSQTTDMCKVIQLYPSGIKDLESPIFFPMEPQIFKDQLRFDLVSTLENVIRKAFRQKVTKWLTEPQVCRRLNISSAALLHLREEGKLPYSLIGAEYYYDPVDVENELRCRKRLRRL